MSVHADSHTDSCDNLLNLVNNPSYLDSPCAVPAKKVVIELNYEYQQLFNGYQHYFPAMEVRLGLLDHNEWVITLPNYIYPVNQPSGFETTITGLKHELINNNQWVIAVETLVSLPGGSAAYGDKNVGVTFNSIISYNLNQQWNLSGMIGGMTATDATLMGGRRFNSINPDLLLSYSPNEKIMTYIEVYGQSKTSSTEGAGFNADEGILLLLSPDVLLNASISQHLTGNLGGFERYVSAGLAVRL